MDLEYIFSLIFGKIVIQDPNWFMNIQFLSFLAFISTCQPAQQREDSLYFYSLSSLLHTLQTRYPHSLNISAGTECATEHDMVSGPASQPPSYAVHSPLVTVTSQSLIVDASCLMYILYTYMYIYILFMF